MSKTYLVIGATSGIGKQLTENLLNDGHKVFATGRNTNEKNVPIGATAIDLDVINFNDDFSNVLPEVIDGIAYCPGNINLKPFNRIKEDDLLNDFKLNVVGAVKVIQVALPHLKKSESPAVVFFSTVAVQTGMTFHAVTATVKAGVEGLTKSLAAEFAPKIRVNCIAPSLTDTPLAEQLLNNEKKRENSEQRHPLKKVGSTNDMAHLGAFLLSDNSSFITGQIIAADGGLSSLR